MSDSMRPVGEWGRQAEADDEYIARRDRDAKIAAVEQRLRDIAAGACGDRDGVDTWGLGVGELFHRAFIADVSFYYGRLRDMELPEGWRNMTFRQLAAAIVDAEKGGGDG